MHHKLFYTPGCNIFTSNNVLNTCSYDFYARECNEFTWKNVLYTLWYYHIIPICMLYLPCITTFYMWPQSIYPRVWFLYLQVRSWKTKSQLIIFFLFACFIYSASPVFICGHYLYTCGYDLYTCRLDVWN